MLMLFEGGRASFVGRDVVRERCRAGLLLPGEGCFTFHLTVIEVLLVRLAKVHDHDWQRYMITILSAFQECSYVLIIQSSPSSTSCQTSQEHHDIHYNL